jgi:hypothetical protein
MKSVAGKTYVVTRSGKPRPQVPRHIAVGERLASANTPATIIARCGVEIANAEEAFTGRICVRCDRA